MHALVAARLGDAVLALRNLRQAAAADLELDPNSAGGIRIAGLGAVWQAVVLGFAGLDLGGETIDINPRLPRAWRGMSFTARWRGRSVQVRINGTQVRVAMADGGPAEVRIAGRTHALEGGAALEVQLDQAAAAQP
jgi:trehalose/maltose hydrolase-like predicted phosphorylase